MKVGRFLLWGSSLLLTSTIKSNFSLSICFLKVRSVLAFCLVLSRLTASMWEKEERPEIFVSISVPQCHQ